MTDARPKDRALTRPNMFEDLHAKGFKLLVPVIPPNAILSPNTTTDPRARGKAPGTLGPHGWRGLRGWERQVCTAEDRAAWHAMGASVGIICGEQPDGTFLVGIDADTLNERYAADVKAAVVAQFGELPQRIGRAPKALFPIRLDAAIGATTFVLDAEGSEKVEILGRCKQFVASGNHPATGGAYLWTGYEGLRFEALPIVPAERITEDFAKRLEILFPNMSGGSKRVTRDKVDQELLKGDIELVRQLVAATPNTIKDFDTRDACIAYMAAIKGATQDDPEEGFWIADAWLQRFERKNYLPEWGRPQWDRIHPDYATGIQRLLNSAQQLGGLSAYDQHYFDAEASALAVAAAEQAEQAERDRFAAICNDDAAEMALDEDAPFLVEGLLDQGAMSVLYGNSNTGKTFVAMDIANCIARGVPWAGMATAAGPTVHVVMEGVRGAFRRLRALKLKRGPAPLGAIIPTQVDLFQPNADLPKLIASIQNFHARPVLIIIDTLARAMATGDENSSQDMGRVIKHVDELRRVTGAHVMLVHHTGKNTANGARGSSALRAATDTELELTKERGVTVTKQRDLETDLSIAFTLEVVEVGQRNGKPLTSCVVVVEPVAGTVVAAAPGVPMAVAKGKPPTAAEAQVAEAMAAVEDVLGSGAAGVKAKDVGDYLEHVLKSNLSKNSVRLHLGALWKKGIIDKPDDGIYRSKNSLTAPLTEAECKGVCKGPEDRLLEAAVRLSASLVLQ